MWKTARNGTAQYSSDFHEYLAGFLFFQEVELVLKGSQRPGSGGSFPQDSEDTHFPIARGVR
uniref:Uncharacterized protein n=1 Tax=Salix viminalis TaxID=40686 RepID=A0A6N2M034_SALVM